jgi:anthranilate phosphoribosyltransferase
VTWCEVTVVREDTGKRLYHSAWITSHELTTKTVPEVVAAGRAHWKVENENFNVLKNRGYRLEHNYGHGKQYLSTVLLSLLLLAFLFHTALHLSNLQYQAIREELGARRTFFNDLRALTRYLYFDSWSHLLGFMYEQLELAPG